MWDTVQNKNLITTDIMLVVHNLDNQVVMVTMVRVIIITIIYSMAKSRMVFIRLTLVDNHQVVVIMTRLVVVTAMVLEEIIQITYQYILI